MKTRYSFGGDEHVYVEMDDEMSLDAFFKSLSMSNAVKEANIDGVTEICPANASFQVRFDPDVIRPDDMMRRIKDLEHRAEDAEKRLNTRIIEIPVYYQDPWTHETLMRFRERHQDPNGTDLEYAARINGYDTVEAFIEAHHSQPWFVSMVGFVAGLPFLYQLVEREKQLQVPKYLRPRTDTPKLTVGYGGCFSCIYSVRGAGCYQMFGVYADADLRSRAEGDLSEGFHGVLQARRYRQMETGGQGGIRQGRGRGGGGYLHAENCGSRVRSGRVQRRYARDERQADGGSQ